MVVMVVSIQIYISSKIVSVIALITIRFGFLHLVVVLLVFLIIPLWLYTRRLLYVVAPVFVLARLFVVVFVVPFVLVIVTVVVGVLTRTV